MITVELSVLGLIRNELRMTLQMYDFTNFRKPLSILQIPKEDSKLSESFVVLFAINWN